MTGAWPPAEIDHVNAHALDNRWANLRSATRTQNNRNTRIRKNNTSGYKGASWDARRQTWVAQITANRRNHRLGDFSTAEAAHAAYCRAAERLHGEFARTA
jgi:hypothetical protein